MEPAAAAAKSSLQRT